MSKETNIQHKARRLKDIDPFHVMDILARARQLEQQGHDIIHLEVGEPDFPSAQPILDAGLQALKEQRTHYTSALGLLELRQAISSYYLQKFNLHMPYQRIIVTTGASAALQLSLAVLVDRDEQVLLADPGYPCNRHFVRLFEGKSVSVNVSAADNYQLSAQHIIENWQAETVAAMLANPSNPTGSLISRQGLAEIIDAISIRKGQLIVDEIYQGLVYDMADFTALSLSENIFVINSFSKYFGMTGWRLGWVVVPEAYIDDVDKLAQNMFLAPPTLSQYAALAAFSDESMTIFNERKNEFKKRRDYLMTELVSLGFKIKHPPQGAFYIYADCSSLCEDSFKFTYDLLEKVGVAITPGLDFGDNCPENFVRFAYTQPIDTLKEAIQRLKRYIKV